MSFSHHVLRLVGPFLILLLAGCDNRQDWNVLLVTFDTTRADRLGCYGNTEIKTPHVDALAASGVRFEHAYTPVPITAPSHSSILTGKYPLAHGFRDNGLFTLGEGQETLAEILSEHGYVTAAAIASYPLLARFGLDQGFDLYDDHLTTAFENLRGEQIVPRSRIYFDERPAGRVNEALYPWLEAHLTGPEADKPFFLWAHYFDPHQPLEPPAPYDQIYPDPYNGEIAYVDESFGRLMERLSQLGVAERTLVIVVADHGEGLEEHGEATHSLLAYDTTLRVPLIIRVPGGRQGAVVPERVSTIDILPTILDALGLETPAAVQGVSLAPTLLDDAALPARKIYAETLSPRLSQGWGELRVLFKGDHKLIFGPHLELYDLAQDPRELKNLASDEPETAKSLQRHLSAFLKEHAVADPTAIASIDEETRRRLVALGYVHAGGGDSVEIEEVLRRDGEPPQDRVGDIGEFTFAKQFMLDGKYLAAHAIAVDLIQRDPGNPSYLEIRVIAEISLGRLGDAEKGIEELRGMRLGGSLVGPIERDLGGAFFRRGEPERALSHLRKSHDHQPTAAGHFLEAQVLGSLGRREEELTSLRAALDLSPSYAPARVGLAIRQAQSGERDLAEQNFRLVLEQEPYFARAHFNFGAFLVEEEQASRAVAHFRRATQLRPDYWQAHRALITLFLALGERPDAENQLSILQRRAPTGEVALARELLEAAE